MQHIEQIVSVVIVSSPSPDCAGLLAGPLRNVVRATYDDVVLVYFID